MTQQMLNQMRREAMRAQSQRATVRMGIVSAYDPAHYAAKVKLQPEDVETGWLPIGAIWVGNKFGGYFPPSPGDVVDVHFQEGHPEAGYISLRFYSTVTEPLPVPSGEGWLVHESGSCLKFKNDGTVEVVSTVQINSIAPLWHHTGDLRVTGDIYDLDAEYGTVGALRAAYNVHRHNDTYPGVGQSGLTDHPINDLTP